MNEKERLLIIESFARYYKNAELNVPNLENREFGIGLKKKIDARHMSFESIDQLRNYLVNNTPSYISYSTAHYEHPSTTPIDKKGWLGADLVFDLDVHSEGKYGVYFKLEDVKQDAIRLSEEFLQDDFGISKNAIFYIFSGNRGYHVHVRSKNTFSLGSQERREIVDYVRGVGLDYNSFFHLDDINKNRIIGPKLDATGYRGRFVKKILSVLENSPSKLYRGFSDKQKKDNFIDGIKQGNWSRIPFSLDKLKSKFSFIAQDLPLLSVDADAAVTYDIKKLIRMPNSIHGSTGFIAKGIKDIESFNPLKDSLPEYKFDVKVTFSEKIPELELLGTTYSFSKGDKAELPLAVALFFILKGSALLVTES